MDLDCPKCGRISWAGAGEAFVDGAPNRAPFVDATRTRRQGEEWRCTVCGHVVWRPSPKQNAIDAEVSAWLASHAE